MLQGFLVWIAGLFVGVSLGVWLGVFVVWPSRKHSTLDEMLERDSELEQDSAKDVNAKYYGRALGGERFALDVLGSRAGRITLSAVHGSATDRLSDKSSRDHASLLYDAVAKRFSATCQSCEGTGRLRKYGSTPDDSDLCDICGGLGHVA